MTTQLQFLLIAVAGWMSRHQQAVIEYLQEENRILLEQLGGKPNRFTDAQRIRLARKAKLCACLGNLTDALHISPQTAETAMKIILGYLPLGSYCRLFWPYRRRVVLGGAAA